MTSPSVPLHAPQIDRINLRCYQSAAAVRQYAAASGWLEPGERLAIELAAEAAHDGAILDLGIGGGRTAMLMLPISRDYHGIDYSLAMVRAARERYPALDIREMDARHLDFADDSFDLVSFSYNGIDSVDLAGRLAILHEVHRVLRRDGTFVFSSLNLRGPAHDEHWPDFHVLAGCCQSPAGLLHAVGRLGAGGINWLRCSHVARADDNVAMGPISAHNFGLVTVFISVPAQVRQLQDNGFDVEAIVEPDGRQIAADGSQETTAPWCHYVARKRVSAR